MKSDQQAKKKVVINDAYIPYLNETSRYLILYGGAGSGKSFFSAQKTIIRLTTEKGHRILGTRKIKDTIRNTVYQDLINAIDSLGVRNEFHITKNELRLTHQSGNEIILVGLDDTDKLKSLSGITSIMCEEADQMSEEDFDQLDVRMRGETHNYKQILLTFNPVDENHWLKRRFFDTEEPKASFLHTTYHDNYYIDEEYKEVLEGKGEINENFYRVYVLGEWGKPEVERPYMYNFSRNKHVGATEFDTTKQVILSFDFNLEPFVVLACQAWRDKDGHHLHIIKEFVSNSSDIEAKLQEIEDYFRTHYGHEVANKIMSNCIVTGDATGTRRQVGMKNNEHAWRQITKRLGINPRSKRFMVPRHNPRVSDNRFLCNAILARHPDVVFDETCKHTINEMVHTEADEEGNIKKKDRNQEAQRADALDCYRYICNAFLRDFNDHPAKYGA